MPRPQMILPGVILPEGDQRVGIPEPIPFAHRRGQLATTALLGALDSLLGFLRKYGIDAEQVEGRLVITERLVFRHGKPSSRQGPGKVSLRSPVAKLSGNPEPMLPGRLRERFV